MHDQCFRWRTISPAVTRCGWRPFLGAPMIPRSITVWFALAAMATTGIAGEALRQLTPAGERKAYLGYSDARVTSWARSIAMAWDSRSMRRCRRTCGAMAGGGGAAVARLAVRRVTGWRGTLGGPIRWWPSIS